MPSPPASKLPGSPADYDQMINSVGCYSRGSLSGWFRTYPPLLPGPAAALAGGVTDGGLGGHDQSEAEARRRLNGNVSGYQQAPSLRSVLA